MFKDFVDILILYMIKSLYLCLRLYSLCIRLLSSMAMKLLLLHIHDIHT
jgi:hypothetical protein